jgi:putative restriction endonuclease
MDYALLSYSGKIANFKRQRESSKLSKRLSLYSKKIANLRVKRTRGIPPRKPIFLLAVLELFEQGLLPTNQIFFSSELIAAYLKYWNQLGSVSQRANISLPFFYLMSDGFWHLKPKPGFDSVLASLSNTKTLRALKQVIKYAFLDRHLFELLSDKKARTSFVDFTISAWFPEQHAKIYTLFELDTFREFQKQLQEKGGAIYNPHDLTDEEKVLVREDAFRRLVRNEYNNRCAVCGMQGMSSRQQTLVDGIHIQPFASSYDDRLDNGIALCKNHQWAFEQGWLSVDDRYHIIVADDLWERAPFTQSLKDFDRKRLFLPTKPKFFPRQVSLQWHREHIFNRIPNTWLARWMG